jgi:ribosomal protein S12 methylthiotransferase
MLVGHPGETEEDHLALLDFIKTQKFDRLGVFTYSHEENTHAYQLEDDVTEDDKNRRKDEIMELQQEISFEKNRLKKGKTFKTIIDRKESNYYIGRTASDSPEVDNEVIIYEKNLKIGAFYLVEITDALEYDLVGKVVKA